MDMFEAIRNRTTTRQDSEGNQLNYGDIIECSFMGYDIYTLTGEYRYKEGIDVIKPFNQYSSLSLHTAINIRLVASQKP